MSRDPEAYDLRSELAAFIDDTSMANPHDIAAKFAEKVPQKHLRSALQQALGQYTRVMVDNRRASNSNPPPPAQRSSRVAAIREAAWERALRASYHVGDGGWKFLGDCEQADVVFAATERREMAKRSNARAEQLEDLAREMTAHQAAHVRDLPENVLARIFGGQE